MAAVSAVDSQIIVVVVDVGCALSTFEVGVGCAFRTSIDTLFAGVADRGTRLGQFVVSIWAFQQTFIVEQIKLVNSVEGFTEGAVGGRTHTSSTTDVAGYAFIGFSNVIDVLAMRARRAVTRKAIDTQVENSC